MSEHKQIKVNALVLRSRVVAPRGAKTGVSKDTGAEKDHCMNNLFLEHKALQIRINSLQATTAAGSGHPTSCLSSADIIAALFFQELRYDYKNPHYHNNDRFVLSKGHAIPVVYAALHQLGVISKEQLLSLRKFDSELEGHPTPRFKYNEAATGSLGQGLAIALGMALQAQRDGLDYKTYVMMGDGEIAEGSVWEAAELAAHYKCDNLVAIVDCNRLGQSGEALHAHAVDRYAKKFDAFGWKSIVIDGHNMQEIVAAFSTAAKTKGQPTILIAKTQKGFGLDAVQDQPGFHGKPFKPEELPGLIQTLEKRFAAATSYKSTGQWLPPQPTTCPAPAASTPATRAALSVAPKHQEIIATGKQISTRKAFGIALTSLGTQMNEVMVLDADVKNSTFTDLFEKDFPNRFIQCFIAEQNLAGVATGLALRGKVPFASTFASFFTRCYDQIRMAGIGRVALRLAGSHSGVAIGQDGPSQMGLEDVAMMSAVPRSVVLWPSDGVSTYKLVMQMGCYNDGISYMKTSRSDMPMLYGWDEKFTIGGCKVLRSSAQDKVCIVAAGITVYEALAAYEQLKQDGIFVSVIDLYSIKPFDQKTVIEVARASGNKIITVEDHYEQGGIGQIVASTLRDTDTIIKSLAVTDVARSGSPEELMAWAGIDAKSIVKSVRSII